MDKFGRKLIFAYPGNLDTPTGGYGYDRRIIAGLRELGWDVQPLSLGEGFPFPSAEQVLEAERRISDLPPDVTIVIDGLAYGAMAEAAERLAKRHTLVALVHHPLCQENGLSASQADRLNKSERSALHHAKEIIVTSPATADQVASLFDIGRQNIHVVVPGTDRVENVPKPLKGHTRLLTVGTAVPRKGYDLLFHALSELKHLDWDLDIVGGTTNDPSCFDDLQAQLVECGLANRIQFHGAVASDQLPRFYNAADIFVLASRYEGYGMAYTEALAHGLPVIGSGGGAVEDTLPEGAAIYCGVEDTVRLQKALELLLTDKSARMAYATSAREAAEKLPTWLDAANAFAKALEGIH